MEKVMKTIRYVVNLDAISDLDSIKINKLTWKHSNIQVKYCYSNILEPWILSKHSAIDGTQLAIFVKIVSA